jgi:hypothetical protein
MFYEEYRRKQENIAADMTAVDKDLFLLKPCIKSRSATRAKQNNDELLTTLHINFFRDGYYSACDPCLCEMICMR